MDFKKLNNYVGWGVFAIATIIYLATIEPTTSLWDCGEYIATSYNLEVGHPPGAPLFMMLGRLFSFFAGPESVAMMINSMSAISSGFTILFLFWTITAFGLKLARVTNEETEEQDKSTKSDDNVQEIKIATKTVKLKIGQMWAILGSGIIGAFAFAFSDSFWFSAVEGEVYAMSAFFTAVTFWAILKWEQVANDPRSDRWLVLIAFLIGLSIGVHLLNLLLIPAIAYVYYFRKFEKTTWLGFILTGVIGLSILILIQNIIIPKTVEWAADFEIMFTNGMGLPFNSGTIFFGLLIIGLIVGGLWYSRKRGWIHVNTAFNSLAVLYIGYSCFAMIPIRSNANPPLDENNPENLPSLNSYLLREQYGDWPLLKGPYFNSVRDEDHSNWEDRSDIYIRAFTVVRGGNEVKGFQSEQRAIKWAKANGGEVVEKYYLAQDRTGKDGSGKKPVYLDEFTTYFPRMYSSDPNHIRMYKYWSGYTTEGKEPKVDPYAKRRFPDQPERWNVYLPSMGENLTYFFKYQIGHMYWRYFLWNFAGRQNDDQNQNGNVLEGNWLSGLSFIDSPRLGDQSKLPEHRASNKAHNKFFFLPLILGLIGCIYQLIKHPKDWFTVLLLFLFTGLMIIIYLNQKPNEPRERDYAYAGSFYAFAIWIGMSVYALYDIARSAKWKDIGIVVGGSALTALLFSLFEGGSTHTLSYSLLYITGVAGAMMAVMMLSDLFLKKRIQQAALATLIAIPGPAIMGINGWDDHDRSDRYSAREMAKNYLRACDENAILFTNGDNDTFPLWYVQEVEGFRTDVRVVNLSLLNTDWYIEQLKRKAYESDTLPISFIEEEYRQGGTRDFVAFPDIVLGYYMDLQRSGRADERWRNAATTCQNNYGKRWDIRTAMNFLHSSIHNTENDQHGSDDRWIKLGGSPTGYLPVNKFYLPIDKGHIKELGIVPEQYEDQIGDTLKWKVGGSGLYKKDLMILEMIARSNWERPIYFAATASKKTYMGLDKYFQVEGLVYRLMPYKPQQGGISHSGMVHTEKMYDLVMDQFDWGNLNKEHVYVDYYNRRPTSNFRLTYHGLAEALRREGELERSMEVLDKSLEEFPNKTIPYDGTITYYVKTYYDIAQTWEKDGNEELAEKARATAKELTSALFEMYRQDINYFVSMRKEVMSTADVADGLGYSFSLFNSLIRYSENAGEDEIATQGTEILDQMESALFSKLNSDLTEAEQIEDPQERSEMIMRIIGFDGGKARGPIEIVRNAVIDVIQPNTQDEEEARKMQQEAKEFLHQYPKVEFYFVSAIYQSEAARAAKENDRTSRYIKDAIKANWPEIITN